MSENKNAAKEMVGGSKLTVKSFLLHYNAVVILIALIIIACIISPLFATPDNVNTLLKQQSIYLVISMGMLMVIITAGIDLAAAGTVALSSIIMVMASNEWGCNTFVCILLAVAIGALVGLFNGFFIAKMKMPAFIVTLALTYIAQGIAFMLTNGNTLLLSKENPIYQDLVNPGFATIAIPGINFPLMAIFAVAIIIIFFIVMKYTKFGRLVYAVGSNETAVQMAGINSRGVIFKVWLLHGILCGIAAFMITARTGNATALTASGDYALSTVAAVVIGGASLAGGEGSVPMTVVGVFVIAVIGNIMNLIGLASYPQMVVKGAVIIFAVILKSVSSKTTE